jgi:hypothetical protein
MLSTGEAWPFAGPWIAQLRGVDLATHGSHHGVVNWVTEVRSHAALRLPDRAVCGDSYSIYGNWMDVSFSALDSPTTPEVVPRVWLTILVAKTTIRFWRDSEELRGIGQSFDSR